MIKKLLFGAAILAGLAYGSGQDLGSLKRQITGSSNENARSLTADDNDGWGGGDY